MFYTTMTVTLLLAALALCAPAEAYQNPLKMPEDPCGGGIADPGIMRYMSKYYLYATKVGGEPGIRCWESKNMVDWTYKGFCTSGQADFADGHGWSPGPFYYNGKFYLYVCSIDQKHRIFESDAPAGPFTCLTRDAINVNSLDAVPFLDDDGQLYLFYAGWGGVGIQYRKCSSPTKPDGENQSLKPCQFSAEDNGNFWTEGPTLYKHNGTYYLAYCGNDWARDSYQVRVAKGKSIEELKPQKTNPIIAKATGEWVAPGCNWIIIGPDLKSLWNVYHVRKFGGGERRLSLDQLRFDPKSGDLLCDGPTFGPMPNPAMPTYSEDFSGKDISLNWTSASGKWTSGGGSLKCEAVGEMRCKVPTGKEFNAEFNLKLADKDATAGCYGVSLCGDDSGCFQVVVDVASKSIELLSGGSSKPLAKASLPAQFTLDVWHVVTVEKREGHLAAYFDGMRKIDADIQANGTSFGFVTKNCRADFGWCGFSNL